MLAWKKTTLMSILIAAAILTFVAFILSITAISLQKWMSYDTALTEVKRDKLMAFSRWRGMFMECLKNTDHAKWVVTSDENTANSCFDLDMGGKYPKTDNGVYWHIMGLRRGHVAMMIISIIAIFATLALLGAALAMTFLPRFYATPLHSRIIKASGWVCLLAIMCLLATLFIFHVLMDEEKYKRTGDPNLLPEIYSSWDATYITRIMYAASYFLTWATIALLSLAALLLLLTFCWGLDRFFTKRVVRTVEEKTIVTGGHYGQPTTVLKSETVHVSEGAARTHAAGDTVQPYSYTSVPNQ